MKGRYLLSPSSFTVEGNIFADKSAMVLDWLLIEGIQKEQFTLREVLETRDVSIGLVHKVFSALEGRGILETSGLRTTKKFRLKIPKQLLESWVQFYEITSRCKMRTYGTRISDKKQLMQSLIPLGHTVALALHSAAESMGLKNTNLETLELYVLDPNILEDLEKTLHLEEQERGYEVLLVEPYYKKYLKSSMVSTRVAGLQASSPLLTYLDLYHFPLRGIEQAEYLKGRQSQLKRMEHGKRR